MGSRQDQMEVWILNSHYAITRLEFKKGKRAMFYAFERDELAHFSERIFRSSSSVPVRIDSTDILCGLLQALPNITDVP
jgi:hypothetical protein